jgi:uncharacterized membrane protein (DUF106 family)
MTAIVELMLYAIGVTVFYTVVTLIFVKPADIRAIKKEADDHRKQAVDAKKSGDMKAHGVHQMEALKVSQKMFNKNMKPMIVSAAVFFLVLGGLGTTYEGLVVLLPFGIPLFGMDMGWFWWYVISTVPFSFALRKIIGFD